MKKVVLALFLLLNSLIFAAGYYTKGTYVYTIHSNHLDEILQTVINGDREMFNKMVGVLQLTGTGGLLPSGREVFITSRGSGTVQFYFKGDAQRYWTVKEAIEYRK